MLLYRHLAHLSLFLRTLIIKGNASNRKIYLFVFPVIAFINEEATGRNIEGAIGAIKEVAIDAIIVSLFNVSMFQLPHQLINLIFPVTLQVK